jgi:hypothetical protein
MEALGLSGVPRIAQGGKPTAIDSVIHQEAFDESAHLVPRDRKEAAMTQMERRS